MYLVTFKDQCGVECVSHGMLNDSMINVPLPQDPVSAFKPVYQDENGYYLKLPSNR